MRDGRSCNKKLQLDSGTNEYRCETCGHSTQPAWRWIAHVGLADHRGSLSATAFDEAGNDMFKITGNEIMNSGRDAADFLRPRLFDKMLVRVNVRRGGLGDKVLGLGHSA